MQKHLSWVLFCIDVISWIFATKTEITLSKVKHLVREVEEGQGTLICWYQTSLSNRNMIWLEHFFWIASFMVTTARIFALPLEFVNQCFHSFFSIFKNTDYILAIYIKNKIFVIFFREMCMYILQYWKPLKVNLN